MSAEKIFNDPIHGTIRLPPILVKIIDTPEFQRLRHLKQLGGAYYVYPEAQHNRFEHSIGTAHLAGKLVEHLSSKQPELGISEQDILCVKVAGLCHDLGHGPFSHLFDGMFLPRQGVKDWKHEEGSCMIFDRIIQRIDPHECKFPEKDRKFIREMINGEEMNADWKHEGRGEEKSFLYDIISNKTNGVDVDKWDYFARDCYHLGISYGFDHNRLIECTKVLKAVVENQPERRRICYRDIEVYNLYEMFHARFSLHKKACQHKGVNAVHLMITDVLCKANPFLEISNPDPKRKSCKMYECVKVINLGAYCKLDDRILLKIEDPDATDLEPARNILKRLSEGDRYRCIGSKVFKKKVDKGKILELENDISGKIASRLHGEFRDHIRVSIVKFNYGKGDKNPIDYCRFYSKEEPKTAKKITRGEVSALLPSDFEEFWVQVFCSKEKLSNEERRIATEAFKEWYDEDKAGEKERRSGRV